jgi:hypothetical protein
MLGHQRAFTSSLYRRCGSRCGVVAGSGPVAAALALGSSALAVTDAERGEIDSGVDRVVDDAAQAT